MRNITLWAALVYMCSTLLPLSAATLEGRVEKIEQGEQPAISRDLLEAGVSESNGLPASMRGKWYGTVEVAQVETYPDLHPGAAYWAEFMNEAKQLFTTKKPGQIVLDIKENRAGVMCISSSDVVLRGGMKLQFTHGRGPALVRGGFNQPTTVTDKVTAHGDSSAEQTRIDQVSIVDARGNLIQRGYSEISASYNLISTRKMALKILEIDYDESGKPLWKILLRGTATR